MSPTIRATLARVGPGLAVGALLVVAASCSGGSPKAAPSTTRARPAPRPSTTIPAGASGSSTTVPPTTTVPPDPNGPVVGAEGAELAPPPATPPVVPVTVPADCHELAPATVKVDCGRGSGATAGLLWVVRHGPGAASGVDVYRVVGAQATLALTANDGDGSSWAGVAAFVADVGGPDGAEIVVGYRLQGTGAQLHVDVVGGNAQVLFHRELDQGRFDTAGGVYRDWSAKFGPDDPNCCPSRFTAETVDFVGGQWRVGRHADIAPSDVPAGQMS
jgi:hypothetical protein